MSFPVSYADGQLTLENVALNSIAEQFGTPAFVYSAGHITGQYRRLSDGLAGHDHLICYAVKANSHIAILALLAKLGAGFDVVSGGELRRVIAAGGDPRRTVFAGVGKSATEIRYALSQGIMCLNVESENELVRIAEIAHEMGLVAPVAFRINPNIDAGTHPYISTGLKQNKFGIPFDQAIGIIRKAREMPHVAVHGIDCHIGSQILNPAPISEALARLLSLADSLVEEGIVLDHIDAGGGLGIRYEDETPSAIADYTDMLVAAMRGRREKLLIEPGRLIVGNAGVLLTRVEYLKQGDERHFAIVDAAMNDLIRPALYSAHHEIWPCRKPGKESKSRYDIVGPVCESADFLGRDRELALAANDLLAVLSTGAYSAVMSSNYNTRPRAAEVLVDGDRVDLITPREEIDAMLSRERIPSSN